MSKEGDSSVSRCLVYCRLRPSTPKDFEDDAYQLVTMDKKRVILKDEKSYEFDGTFGAECTQEDIFNHIAVPCISHTFNGFCSALMCYGQTGTGKSFTLCCTKPGVEGVIPRAAKLIFETIMERSNDEFEVTGQFVQIYRDQLGDLMVDGGRDRVDIRFDAENGVTLTNCTSHPLKSEEQFMAFYNEGNSRRVTTATAMNPESSRSHSAMVIMINSRKEKDISGSTTRGKITFIDLAGYERFSKTGISNADPIMKDEAKTINASLLSLGHVVTSLSNNDNHIPWRNSKLTRILQDSIGGRSMTSIILTLGPSSEHLYESTNSLQFGQRAMAVKVEARKSVTTDFEQLAAKLQLLLDEKEEQINLLEIQIRARDVERAEVTSRHRRDDETLRERFKNQLAEMKVEGATDEQLLKLEEIFQVEVQNLKEQQLEEVDYQEEQHNKTIVCLAAEQQRRERRKQMEMKVSQEKVISEFENKLASLSENCTGNEELVKALAQLTERDLLLVSRADDIANLHAQVEILTEALRETGAVVPEMEEIHVNYIDLSQVEEIQARHQMEKSVLENIIVNLRTEIESLRISVDSRTQEVTAFMEDVKNLEKQLEDAGMQRSVSEGAVHVKKMIDEEELIALRTLLQADIEQKELRNRELENELIIARRNSEIMDNTPPISESHETPTERMASYTPRPLGTPRLIGRSDSHMKHMSFRKVSEDSEKEALDEKLHQAEKKMVTMARELNLAISRTEQLKVICENNNIDTTDSIDPDGKVAISAIEEILAARNCEVERLLEVVTHLHQVADNERSARAKADERVASLTKQLEDSSIIPSPSPAIKMLPTSRVDIDVFMNFVKAARYTSTKVSNFSLMCTIDTDKDLTKILEEKDNVIDDREARLLSSNSTIGHLASLVKTLEEQILASGAKPVVEISDDIQDAIDKEVQRQEKVVENATNEIKTKLKNQEEEKEKVKMILNKLSSERTAEAKLLEKKCQDLENRLASESKKQEAANASAAAAVEDFEKQSSEYQNSLFEVISNLEQKLADKELELTKMTQLLMKEQATFAENNEKKGFMYTMKKLL